MKLNTPDKMRQWKEITKHKMRPNEKRDRDEIKC